MPKGFVASKATGENTVENGFVIYQGTEDVTNANVSTAMTTRNQFVWVPVPDTNKMFDTHEGKAVGRLYGFDKSTKKYTEREWSSEGQHEPDVVTKDSSKNDAYDAVSSNYSTAGIIGITNAEQFKAQLETEFAKMKESVERYHGFYIGRYETGEGGKIVKGTNPLTAQTWYKQYQLDKSIINANGIKSSMIWGSQWDQTLIWFHTQGIEKAESAYKKEYVYDSTGKGHYDTSTIAKTGSSTVYAMNNIYDMAGNSIEWTLEAGWYNSRVLRGRTLPREWQQMSSLLQG